MFSKFCFTSGFSVAILYFPRLIFGPALSFVVLEVEVSLLHMYPGSFFILLIYCMNSAKQEKGGKIALCCFFYLYICVYQVLELNLMKH